MIAELILYAIAIATSKSPLTLDITISIACYQSDTVALVAPARALIEFSR
jgi:hypothetical protein